VVASGVANLPVKKGNTFGLYRLQHFTSPAKEPPVSLVVDVCATGLADAASYTKGAFESEAFAGAADPPSLGEALTPPSTKGFGFLKQKDPAEMRKEAQHEAAFEAAMGPGRELHEKEKVAEDAVRTAALLRSYSSLGSSATRSRAPNDAPRNQHRAGYRSRICLNKRRYTNLARETRTLCPVGRTSLSPWV
jgi:hypothetical protein